MAVPFDVSRRATTGVPVAVLSNVTVAGAMEAVLATTDSGTLVYPTGTVRGSSRVGSRLVRLRGSEITPLPFDPDYFKGISVSPNGLRLAAAMWDGSVWVYELARRTRMKLPPGDAPNRSSVVWTLDSERVVFVSAAHGFNLHIQRADGVSLPELLLKSATEQTPASVTPDGKALMFVRARTAEPGSQIWRLPLEADGAAEPVPIVAGSQMSPSLSPDGRWLASSTNETGVSEVFVQPYPKLNRKTQASVGSGFAPQWSGDGSILLLSPWSADDVRVDVWHGPADRRPARGRVRPRVGAPSAIACRWCLPGPAESRGCRGHHCADARCELVRRAEAYGPP